MRLISVCGLFTVGVLFSAVATYAQFTPLTAKMKNTSEMISGGKVTTTEAKEGVYYRRSDGSFYRQWTKVDGKEKPGVTTVAELWDNESATAYRLDLTNHVAYQREKGPGPTHPDDLYKNHSKSLAEDYVAGVKCALMPSNLIQSGQAPVHIGTTCMSIEYNLMLKSDLTYSAPGGKISHTIYQLYDVELGTEPDATLFSLKNYTVYRPETKN